MASVLDHEFVAILLFVYLLTYSNASEVVELQALDCCKRHIITIFYRTTAQTGTCHHLLREDSLLKTALRGSCRPRLHAKIGKIGKILAMNDGAVRHNSLRVWKWERWTPWKWNPVPKDRESSNYQEFDETYNTDLVKQRGLIRLRARFKCWSH